MSDDVSQEISVELLLEEYEKTVTSLTNECILLRAMVRSCKEEIDFLRLPAERLSTEVSSEA